MIPLPLYRRGILRLWREDLQFNNVNFFCITDVEYERVEGGEM